MSRRRLGRGMLRPLMAGAAVAALVLTGAVSAAAEDAPPPATTVTENQEASGPEGISETDPAETAETSEAVEQEAPSSHRDTIEEERYDPALQTVEPTTEETAHAEQQSEGPA